MTFFDPRSLERLTAEQKVQYEEFLKAYPHLASKMDTSRQLNTPGAQEMRKNAAKKVEVENDSLDLEDIERTQKDASEAPAAKPRPIAEMHVDAKRASMLSLDQEEKEKEKRQEARLRRQQQEEASKRYADENDADVPPPQQRRTAPSPQQEDAPGKRPPRFSPTGKKHPVLLKLRQSLGMDDLEKPATVEIQGVTYTFKRLMREEIAKAIGLATARTVDETSLRSFMETAIVACAIREIDGTDVADVFDVPFRELRMTTGREDTLTLKERQNKGTELLFAFLIDTPTELTDTLITFYEQYFPPVNLLDEASALALCPVPNCAYRAIVNTNTVRFCPHHGKELRHEETLPNPS